MIFWFSHEPDLTVSSDDLVDLVVRKAAHVFVFGVLALLCARLWGSFARSGAHVVIGAWLLTLAFAVSDEWHQTFVHGRVGHAQDVAIDLTGATAALLLDRAWRRRRAAHASPSTTVTPRASEELHR